MNQRANLFRDSLILLMLVALGVASRFALVDLPNFKPIAAIVLFVAFWFRSYKVAGLSMLLMILVSNHGLEDCPWQVTVGVVGGLAVAAWLGRRLGRQFGNTQAVRSRPLAALGQLVGSAFAMSLAFFVISNFAVWSMGQWYPLSAAGLLHCFAAAIPFFKYTFCGDLMFSSAIFAAWFALNHGVATEPATHLQSVVDQG